MLPGEEIKVNMHTQLDKGSGLATGTSRQEEQIFPHTDLDLQPRLHTTQRNKPGMGPHLSTSWGYTPSNYCQSAPHVP